MTDRFDMSDVGWQANGNCLGVDPNLMFPERGESLAPAKAICRECSVKAECLDYALRVPEVFGVWGGVSERERRRLRKAAPKICLHCRGEFYPANRHHRICSDGCRAERERVRAAEYRKRAS